MTFETTALVFPGQGSQVIGMGQDVAAAYDIARQTFAEADDLLGFSLSEMCFSGPEEALNSTINTQPALFVCSIAILRALQSQRPDASPRVMAGHSLGELTALTAAGALSFADGLRLVRERGRLMEAAGQQNPGAMAALLGPDTTAVRELCARIAEQTGKVLVLANDNCPGQAVISGDVEAVDAAIADAKSIGARRALKLAVSIASHSPLMAPAQDGFRAALANTPISAPTTPVVGNVTAALLSDADAIREELANQLTQSVRWTESVQAMITSGVTQIVEIGSKDVLVGLVKRIDASVTATALNSADALRAFVG